MGDSERRLGDYVDAREINSKYRKEECWNCGNVKYVRTRWITCTECFMGQEKLEGDRRSEHATDDGYMDYRLLWYGDVSLEEARRRYEESAQEVREVLERREARNRAVRI